MIKALIFDLDGTLVETEKLKAQAYAIAVQKLRNLTQPDLRAIGAYIEVVGSGREAASRHVMEKLELEKELRPLIAQYHVLEPWEVLTAMRLAIYSKMIADPELIQQNKYPYTLELLKIARKTAFRTALSTMSQHNETLRILQALGILKSFDIIVTSEDVKHSKPDPEIYLLLAQKLNLPSGECLVIEDSPSGVQSATAAGMHVIALATPFTFFGLHSQKIGQTINHASIVHRPEKLVEVAQRFLREQVQIKERSGSK